MATSNMLARASFYAMLALLLLLILAWIIWAAWLCRKTRQPTPMRDIQLELRELESRPGGHHHEWDHPLPPQNGQSSTQASSLHSYSPSPDGSASPHMHENAARASSTHSSAWQTIDDAATMQRVSQDIASHMSLPQTSVAHTFVTSTEMPPRLPSVDFGLQRVSPASRAPTTDGLPFGDGHGHTVTEKTN